MIKTYKGTFEVDGTGRELIDDFKIITVGMFTLMASKIGKEFAREKLREEFEDALEDACGDEIKEDLMHDIVVGLLKQMMESEGK